MSTSSSRMTPAYFVGTVAQLLGCQYSNKERAVFSHMQPATFPNGFMTFFDPGWSILALHELVANKRIFCPQTWYDNEPFARLDEQPRYHQLQMEAVKDSFGKTFAEQQALVSPGEEIPMARVVLTGMIIHFLATGERLYFRLLGSLRRSDLGRSPR